jgi:RNA polymerase primary sigma factor
MQESLQMEIKRTLDTLTDREANVIRLNYGLDGNKQLSLSEIGELFDLTRERVRQIREKAIRRLRHQSKNKTLIAYLG